ncbi:MAG: C-terminal binding protein [Aggregatilineales bacterium]
MTRVAVTDSDFKDIQIERTILGTINAQIEQFACRTPAAVVSACRNADALIVQWAPITRGVLEELTQVKAIVRYGIGVDMIDVNAATDLGIAVCNTPNYCIEEVATHTLSLILALARGLYQIPAALSAHQWGFNAVRDLNINRLSDQTLGLLGLGRIGKQVARYIQNLGMHVVAYDPYSSDSEIEYVSLEALLDSSDWISLHCPLTPETHHIINAQALARMKPQARLVNTSRGNLIDMEALVHALRTGRIAGAALDVLPTEPPNWDDNVFTTPNLILTPHIAWYSSNSPTRMRQEAANSLVQLFTGSRPTGLLNPLSLQSARWGK